MPNFSYTDDEYPVAPEAIYWLHVAEIRERKSKKGDPQWGCWCEIDAPNNPQADGVRLWHNVTFSPNAAWAVSQFIAACGYPMPEKGQSVSIEKEEIQGLKFRADVGITDEYGRKQNFIRRLLPYEKPTGEEAVAGAGSGEVEGAKRETSPAATAPTEKPGVTKDDDLPFEDTPSNAHIRLQAEEGCAPCGITAPSGSRAPDRRDERTTGIAAAWGCGGTVAPARVDYLPCTRTKASAHGHCDRHAGAAAVEFPRGFGCRGCGYGSVRRLRACK
jgi:hypothetical protein